ncbi:MAG: FAD binding domain-containing protein, partial [Chloroflexota bacterium]
LLLCLEAVLVTSQRQLSLADFLIGPYEVALEEGELLEAILIPWLPAGWRAHYRKVQFHERPMLGLALVTGDGRARVAIGSASPTPRRGASAEALLAEGRLAEASDALAGEADLIDDLEGSAEYKRHLIRVELRRAWEGIHV